MEHRSVLRLLEHQGWVRELARRLVHDPGQAEDVAQNTWVAALEHPPASADLAVDGRAQRRWLAAVAHNAARQLRRGEARRTRRERDAARVDATPSTAELLERAALQRRVVEAVEGLDEPYRTTLLLRFLEELPPREIARRQGPVELVLPTDRLYPRVAGRVVSASGEPVAGAAVYPQCDPYVSRAAGQVVGTSHMSIDGTRTDAEGRFELRNVPVSLVYLRVEGDDILPVEFGRAGEGPDRVEGDVNGIPGDSVVDLEIHVLRRAHLQVTLTDPTAADHLSVLDAAGERLMLNVIMARSRNSGHEMPIRAEGRSDTIAVPETGATLLLLLEGREVGRLPLQLVPGEIASVVY